MGGMAPLTSELSSFPLLRSEGEISQTYYYHQNALSLLSSREVTHPHRICDVTSYSVTSVVWIDVCQEEPTRARHIETTRTWELWGQGLCGGGYGFEGQWWQSARQGKKERLRCTCPVGKWVFFFPFPTFNSICPLGKLERTERTSVLEELFFGQVNI